MTRVAIGVVLAAVLILALVGPLKAQIVEAGPDRLSQTRSLADRIVPGSTLHIIYVHGMRADGPGAAAPLAQLLREKLGFGGGDPGPPQYVDLGRRPSATYNLKPIWESDDDWKASRPFVIRRELSRADKTRVIIDEVNWWPLLFPLKCQFIVVPEHLLSGDDKAHLNLCGLGTTAFHDWVKASGREFLAQPRRGRAALLNRTLKQQIMNWGLADAVIALGPMQDYLRRTMDQAFKMASDGSGSGSKVVMSESLGSFVVMDAMTSSQAVRNFVRDSDDLYFFANQFALLELGRIDRLKPVPTPSESVSLSAAVPLSPPNSPFAQLRDWASGGHELRESPKQIIAFSDPSDLLTYPVPRIDGAIVVNLYDRNEFDFFGLFAWPGSAHTGHLANKAVKNALLARH